MRQRTGSMSDLVSVSHSWNDNLEGFRESLLPRKSQLHKTHFLLTYLMKSEGEDFSC